MATVLEIIKPYVFPEVIEHYAESIRLCNLCNQDQITDIIEQELMLLGESNTQDIIVNIDTLTKDFLRTIISSHEVELNEDVTLEGLNKTLEALLELPYYIDKEALARICEQTISNEEKFSAMAELVTAYTENDFFLIVEKVSDSFIKQLSGVVGDIDSVERTIYPKIVYNLKQLINFYQSKDFLGSILIYNDIVLGMPFERYIPYFTPRLHEWTVEQTAKELLYILYMSKDGFEQPLETYKQYCASMYIDVNVEYQIKNALVALIDRFNVYLKSAEAKNLQTEIEQGATK